VLSKPPTPPGTRSEVRAGHRARRLRWPDFMKCLHRPRLALVVPLLLVAAVGRAAASPPLLGVEARVAGGVSIAGTTNKAGLALGALTVGVLAEYAVRDQPRVSLYGEALFEGLKRGGFGLAGGVRLRPFNNGLRLGIGVVGMLTPYTHGGAAALVGQCFSVKFLRLCVDLEGAAYFLGSDLPTNGIDGQVKLALAVGFDAL